MSFGRLLQRIVLKWVLHMQHNYFSSFNQLDHCFLASSLPSYFLKLSIVAINVTSLSWSSSSQVRITTIIEILIVIIIIIIVVLISFITWKHKTLGSRSKIMFRWTYYPVSCDHRSYERCLSNCVQKPEKVRTSTGFEPLTSRYRCDALTNWAMKPLTLGASHLWVLMSPWRMDVKWYMK